MKVEVNSIKALFDIRMLLHGVDITIPNNVLLMVRITHENMLQRNGHVAAPNLSKDEVL